jgi:hypothetical protein
MASDIIDWLQGGSKTIKDQLDVDCAHHGHAADLVLHVRDQHIAHATAKGG